MQVQGLVVNLRLRGMHEAADLGLRLAQENRSAWRLFLPPWIVLCAIALCYPGSNGWVPVGVPTAYALRALNLPKSSGFGVTTPASILEATAPPQQK